MKIENRKTSALIPYASNSRTHSQHKINQIADSIREFGFCNPVLIDANNEIIAGHGRVMAAGLLGLKEVPCIVLGHLSDRQKKAYVIADNKIALNAGWDFETLSNELSELSESDFNIDIIEFNEQELDALLKADAGILPENWEKPNSISFSSGPSAQIEAKQGLVEDDQVPSEPNVPVSVRGDVWLLGGHRLMCGDSTSQDDVAQLMAGERAHLVVTDPPYNVAYEGKTSDSLTIMNDKMDGGTFYQFLLSAYRRMFESTVDGGGLYVFHADSEGMNFRKAMTDAGFKLAQCCVWVKNSLVMGRQDYHWRHEPVLYGWKPTGSHRWFSDRSQTTVWNFDRPTRNDVHPTMKPIDLVMYPIKNSSQPGEIVLDLFGGAGSTMIAAEKLSRVSRLMELDPKYADVIVQRFEEFTGLKAIHQQSKKTFEELKLERLG